MVYVLTLAFHIIIACLTLCAVVYSSYALYREKRDWFKKLALFIALCAALEVASGFALAVFSPTATVAGVALHLVAYLGLCLVTEAALLVNARRIWIG
jgi:hypothetical protein